MTLYNDTEYSCKNLSDLRNIDEKLGVFSFFIITIYFQQNNTYFNAFMSVFLHSFFQQVNNSRNLGAFSDPVIIIFSITKIRVGRVTPVKQLFV